LRKLYHLEDFITLRHLENCAKLTLATGLIVGYGYIIETFCAWYSGNIFDAHQHLVTRMTGYYSPWYWALIGLNIGFVQVLWFKKIRTNPVILWVVSFILLGAMWLERFVIVIVSLSQDFLVSSWGIYTPTRWDWAVFIGTLGMFTFLFMLFIRALPMISVFEMKTLLPASEVKAE
jgi:molybdopterin-containing oxidoreductase family membrane subunit